ncbi:MAG: DUF2884 family protein [bacterium]|nr:MAG: DUF2884 family protein [bacterium]
MRTVAILTVISIVVLTSVPVMACGNRKHSYKSHRCVFSDDVDIDIDDGTLVFTDEDSEESVEITEDYELYINDDRIELNEEQQELVEKFYDRFISIIDYAKEIGLEGVKIGASGAKLGLKAMVGVVKMLLTRYDRDDLEWELEREAEKIEAKAKKLERKADKIEDMVDELEDIHFDMKASIPELDRLEWF